MQKYWAFISYSHSDSRWADWLHRRLETYQPPKQLVGVESRSGVIPKRLFPVFRDRDELPTSASLGDNITAALRDSRFLIVICSPRAAQSRWVGEEILTFKRLGGSSRILCLIVGGEPNASDHGQPEQECFPSALRFEIDASGKLSGERTEPIAADVREGKDKPADALLKLVAGVLGVDYDALRQREKRRKRNRILKQTTAALLILGVFAGSLGWMKSTEKRKLRGQESARLTLSSERLNTQDERGKALAYLARAMRLDSGNLAAADLAFDLLSGHAWPVVVGPAPAPPPKLALPPGWMVADSSENVRKRRSPPAEPLRNDEAEWPRQFGESGDWLAIRQRDRMPERFEIWRVGEGAKWHAEIPSKGEPLVAFDAEAKVVYAVARTEGPKVETLADGNVKLVFPLTEIRAWDLATGKQLPSPPAATEKAPRGLGAICAAISGDRSTIILPGAEESVISRNGWNGPFEKLEDVIDVQEAIFSPDGAIAVTRNPAKLGGMMQLDRPEIRVIAPKARHPVGFPWLLHHMIDRMWLAPDAGCLLVEAETGGVRKLLIEDLARFQPLGELAGISKSPVRDFTRDGVWIDTVQGLRRSNYKSVYSSEPIPPSMQRIRIHDGAVDREGSRWELVEPQVASWAISGASLINGALFEDYLITASADGIVSCYWYLDGRAFPPLAFPESTPIVAMSLLGKSNLAVGTASASGESIVQVVDLRTGDSLHRFAFLGTIEKLQTHGSSIFGFFKEGSLVRWKVDAAEEQPKVFPLPSGTSGLAFAPDGRTWACLAGGHVQVSSNESAFQNVHQNAVAGAEMSGGAIVIDERNLLRWSWVNDSPWLALQKEWPLPIGFRAVADKAFLLPKEEAVLAGSGSMFAIFDFTKESWRFEPVLLEAEIAAVAWMSPSELAIGCHDGTLHFMSAETGRPVRAALELQGPIRQLAMKESLLVLSDTQVIAISAPDKDREQDSAALGPLLAETIGGWKLSEEGIPQRIDNPAEAFAAARAFDSKRKNAKSRWSVLTERLLYPSSKTADLMAKANAIPGLSADASVLQQCATADGIDSLCHALRLPLVQGNGFFYDFPAPQLMTTAEREVTDPIVRRRHAEAWHLSKEELSVLEIGAAKIRAIPSMSDAGGARLYRDARARLLTASALNWILKSRSIESPGTVIAEETRDEKTGEVRGIFKRTIFPSSIVVDESAVRFRYKQLWEGFTATGERKAFGSFDRSMAVSVDRIARALLNYFGGGPVTRDTQSQMGYGRKNVDRAIEQLKLPGPQSRYLFVGLSTGAAEKLDGDVEPMQPLALEERIIEFANETVAGGMIVDLETGRIVAFGGGAASMDWAPVQDRQGR